MSDRLVKGLWDCPYCEQKGIDGLTKHCPACGHPQDSGTKFYLGEKIEYVEDDVAAEYGQGADWTCEYCGSMNRVHYKFCSNCGAPKDSSEHDYFNRKEKNINKLTAEPPARHGRIGLILGVIAVALALLIFVSMPKSMNAEVTSQSWSRSISVEKITTVNESDWYVPAGGRVYDEKSEIQSYRQVLDHYETEYRQVAEQVYDGEDTHTSYEDNGDGTFTEHTYTTPRYRTEYHTEEVAVPVYRDEPVYATKYYYEIERWLPVRSVDTGGDDASPEWGELVLKKGEREGERTEEYILSFKNKKGKEFTASLDEESWKNYKVGDTAELKVKSGAVISVDGSPAK